MNILSRQHYERVLRMSLRQLGCDRQTSELMITSRWPMNASGMISEADGRGLQVERSDVEDFLLSVAPGPEANDPVEVFAGPELFDNFIAWCVEHRRGKPTFVATLHNGDIADITETMLAAERGTKPTRTN